MLHDTLKNKKLWELLPISSSVLSVVLARSTDTPMIVSQKGFLKIDLLITMADHGIQVWKTKTLLSDR
ncbi:unnamed protein product [Brassica oleracea var. botrytis]